jgi:ankyrin repeat protein
MAALDKQNVRAVQSFLRRGWNPKESLGGTNPLNVAGGTKVARLLVEAGADVNARFKYLAPLIIHADSGNVPLVDYLLRTGVDPNTAHPGDKFSNLPRGTTALIKAAGHGYFRIVKRLLAAGADVNALDEHGRNALWRAVRYNHTEVAKELLRRGSRLVDDILSGPVFRRNVELAKLLIAKGANVNCVFRNPEKDRIWPDGKTVLGYAIEWVGILDYPMKMIELLLKAGADPNQPSKWYYLRKSGKKEGPDVGLVTPLRIAAGRGLEEVMNLLWKAGAKESLQEAMSGWSLDRACFHGETTVVKLLIKAGADVNQPGFGGKTPLQFAREKGHTEIIKLLEKAGARD